MLGLAACAPTAGVVGGPSAGQPWLVTKFASALQVAGYVDRPSINRGEDVALHLNCIGADAGAPVKIAVHRTGWYGGVGARTYLPTTIVTAPLQQAPAGLVDPVANLCEADWSTALTFSTSDGLQAWPSGVYVIQLTAQSGQQAYVPFTVRDDSSTASILVVQNHLTWSAYNNAGGKSLYNGGKAVSFHRPYQSDPVRSSAGAGSYFWQEYRCVRWLERNGYDITYIADIDLDRAPVPESAKVMLFSGHPEYWTGAMRHHVEDAMSTRGTGLVVLGANTCYWRGRIEGATATSPGRYALWKTDSGLANPSDPLRADPDLASRLYRTIPGQAEQYLLGAQFFGWVDSNAYSPGPALPSMAMVAADVSHPVFTGTGIATGEKFPGLCGGEYDWWDPAYGVDRSTVAFNTPIDWVYSNHHDLGRVEHQQSTLRETQHPGGVTSRVFNAGSQSWCWGLDNFSFEAFDYRFANPKIQALTGNILSWAAKDI